ncbi:magnesium/cobalt transporter CorA [Symmachiella dynata]|uniref:magnesium/cobalt transporter CorA n=1 Tax=Symmachiella dynata TaxID=2527995 RepID=UPI0030EC2AAE
MWLNALGGKSLFKKRHPDVGARPGTLVISEDASQPKIHVMHFTPDELKEEDVTDTEQLRAAYDPNTTTWVDVQGFGDEKMIRRIAEKFAIHPLAIEDIINVPQRPKAETYDDQILIIVRMVNSIGQAEIDIEQVSIVLGKNYVLTFQERYGDVLDPVRRRIRSGKGRIRTEGPDYVAYAIFDTIVDAYYPVLEEIGNYLEDLEITVVENPTPRLLKYLNQVKNRLINLRRAIWPQRQVANSLARDEHPLIDPNVRIYLRDTYDHCVQSAEVVEMYREMVTGLMNMYLASVANRQNEIMKVLTITAAIFIPLTFMAGIYGMNFEYMPELHVPWAYPVIWTTMFFVAGGMLFYFYRKGWIWNRDDDEDLPGKDGGP